MHACDIKCVGVRDTCLIIFIPLKYTRYTVVEHVWYIVMFSVVHLHSAFIYFCNDSAFGKTRTVSCTVSPL